MCPVLPELFELISSKFELAEHIHALALHTYTEKEWHDYYADNTPLSPQCLGSGKKSA